MSVTYAAVIKAYPALTSYPQDKVEFWISKADVAITEARFGANVKQAQLLYVAHSVAHTHAPIGKSGKRSIPAHLAPPKPKTKSDELKLRAAGAWKTTTFGVRLARMANH